MGSSDRKSFESWWVKRYYLTILFSKDIEDEVERLRLYQLGRLKGWGDCPISRS